MGYSVPDYVRTSRDSDGAILFDVARGAMFDLNDVAARIWDGVRGGRSESQIVELLRAAFPAVPVETIDADVRATIVDLKSKQVLLTS